MGWFSELFLSIGFLILTWMLLLLIAGLVMRWKQIIGFRIKKEMIFIMALILVLALGIRLASPWGMNLEGETSDYLGYALHYAETGELKYDRHPPGYSFLLAFAIALGSGYIGLIALSIVLGLTSVVLGFILGREVTHSDLGGYVMAVLVAFHSSIISSSVTIWRDGAIVFFGMLTLLLWQRLLKGKDVGIPFVLSFIFLSLMDLRSLIIIVPLGMLWVRTQKRVPAVYLFVGLVLTSPFVLIPFQENTGLAAQDLVIYGGDVEYSGLFSLQYISVNAPLIAKALAFSSFLVALLGFASAVHIVVRKRRWLYLLAGLVLTYASMVTFWGLFFFRGGIEMSMFLIFLFLLVAVFFKEFLMNRSKWVRVGAVVVLGLSLLPSYIDGEAGSIYPDLELDSGVLLTIPGTCDCSLPLSTFLSFALPDQELVFYYPDEPLPTPPYRVLRFTDDFLVRPGWIQEQDEMFEALGILTLEKEKTVRRQTIYRVTHNGRTDS
jgi:hypothetical protein